MDAPRYYRIGEMSELFNVPVKTLRYYEEYGILSPAFVSPGSGYRYYDESHFEKLRLILYLRRIGISLADIKAIVTGAHARLSYVAALERHRDFLEDRIKDDQFAIFTLNRRLGEISASYASPRNSVIIRRLPAQSAVRFPYAYSSREELERGLLAFRQNTTLDWRFARVGQVLPRESFEKSEFFSFSAIQVNSPTLYDYREPSHLVHIPEREWAMLFCDKRTDACAPFWVELKGEISRRGYVPDGDAVRSLILESGIDGGDYLACLAVPVRRADE